MGWDVDSLPIQPRRDPRYYIQNTEDKIMDVHSPHTTDPKTSLCGENGLVSLSPVYVVTCSECLKLAREK